MAGVHGLHHVERLGSAHLADDDAVRPHAQRILNERALVDLAAALHVGRPGFELDHMLLLKPELCGVLDGDDALAGIDHARKRIEQGGFAGAGAAGNDDVETAARRNLQHMREFRRHASRFGEPGEIERRLRKSADRQACASEAQRRNDDVDTAAVRKPRVQERARFVDASSDGGSDALRDVQNVGVMAELELGQLKLALPLHIDHVRPVHEDIGHGWIVQQRLDRAEAHHLVHDGAGEDILLALVQQNFAFVGNLGNQPIDEKREFRPGHPHRGNRLDAQKHLIADDRGNSRGLSRPSFCLRGNGTGLRGQSWAGRGIAVRRRFAGCPLAENSHLSKYPLEKGDPPLQSLSRELAENCLQAVFEGGAFLHGLDAQR